METGKKIWLFSVIAFFSLAAFCFIKCQVEIRTMTKTTMGVLVSQNRSSFKGHSSTHNKVEYEVDGYTYTLKQDGEWRGRREGSPIRVHYNPKRPQQAYAGAMPGTFVWVPVFAICGSVALAYPLFKRFLK